MEIIFLDLIQGLGIL